MRVGVVHTFASPCTCHATILDALRALGHESVENDSDVEESAGELAKLDLVFDWTDTLYGKGAFRHLVQRKLEAAGARCVGSANAVFTADNKVVAKEKLRHHGIPTPEWRAAFSAAAARATPELAEARRGAGELDWPRVVKPADEQMSRGLALVHNALEERLALEELSAKGHQQMLVEEYHEGRELGVTVLGNARPFDFEPGKILAWPSSGKGNELAVLPIAEWPLGGEKLLGYEAKRAGPDPVVAALEPEEKRRIEGLSAAAFVSLGLCDIARFDVRLDEEGVPWFLEANVKPSLEKGSPTLVSAASLGKTPTDLVATLIGLARERHGL